LRSLKIDFAKFDNEVLTTLRENDKNIPLVSVLFSGRPMLIDNIYSNSNAVIAAWLPGTSGGQGIIDALTGDYVIRPSSSNLKNSLSMDWPKDMVQLMLYRQLLKTSLFMEPMELFPQSTLHYLQLDMDFRQKEIPTVS
jgi:beta-glucosidase